LPIDLTGGGNGSGTGGGNNNQPFLDCYNKFLSFIDYYQDKENKPEEYDILVMYLSCLNGDCSTCLTLPYTKLEGRECFVDFCDLTVPDLPEEEEEEEVEIPDFPEIDLGTGVDDTWDDEEPEPTELESDPFVQRGPVWWYHSDHLGSTSYITDILGMPCQYIEYLPFGEVMVQQSTNNIFENVYKFNAKELDESTGYYYYGARYYDPAISIFLSVDPLAEQFPNYNPYTYTMNNPVNLVDPTGMAPEGKDDWFVNKRTGNVVKIGGVSDLTNLSSDDVEKFGLGNVNDYNRLGKDDMFGDVGHPGLEGRVTDYDNLKMNSESENFMRNNGYYKAQSLLIEEKEMTSGGRMGNENFSQTTGSIKQLKTLGITYAKLNQFNEKSDIREDEFLGNNMFVKTATYTYTVGMNGSTQVTNPLYRSNQRGIPGTGNTVLNIAKGAVEALSDLIGIRKK
jgi:RHS repeat-associated protein